MECSGHMGVPIEEPSEAGHTYKRAPGGCSRSIELFTGAGGLALGIEKAGFRHHTVVERDKDCCQTIRENERNGYPLLEGWRLYPGDVREFDYSEIKARSTCSRVGRPTSRSQLVASIKDVSTSVTCSRRWRGQCVN
jgi:hypothetical protein